MIGVFLEKPFDGPIMEKKLFLFSLINYSILFPKAHVALDLPMDNSHKGRAMAAWSLTRTPRLGPVQGSGGGIRSPVVKDLALHFLPLT